MSISLTNIIGIDKNLAEKFKANGISTIKQLYDATRTDANRKKLAKEMDIPLKNIVYSAMQAELLRVNNLSPEDAVELINAGVYTVDQLKKTDSAALKAAIKSNSKFSALTEKEISRFQTEKIASANRANFTATDIAIIEDIIWGSTHNTVDSSYNDLSQILTKLGEGIASAQLQLDNSFIELQNEILENKALVESGISATRYVMPEISFDLKMDYSISQEEKTETTRSIGDQALKTKRVGLRVLPTSAKINALCNSSKKIESTLIIKFAPIPPENENIMRRKMPNVVGEGINVAEAINKLEDNYITDYDIVRIATDGNTEKVSEKDYATALIHSQNPDAESYVLIGQKVTLTIK